MTLVQFIIVGLAALIIFKTILNFKEKKVTFKLFIFWTALWIIIMVAAVLPKITTFFSEILGIGRGVDVAVYFSIILIFFLLYRIIIHLEKIDQEITQIIRHLALKNSKKK